MRERLQKILASAGIASRRAAEAMIVAGDVTVNGRRAELGQRADPTTDDILIRGHRLPTHRPVYLAMNKPAGIVTSLRSTHGERTVAELVATPERIFPVGRLDRETTGLLLLTNDGDWANLVTHPRFGVEKEYLAHVDGEPSRATLEQLRRGVKLPDGTLTAPAGAQLVSSQRGTSLVKITVTEGKKRQIRLMLAAVGHPVRSLERTRIGPLQLGRLQPGQVRYLSLKEVESVRDMARGATAPGGPRRAAARRG